MFRVLDIVRVADLPALREDGSAGHEGFVCRVRQYDSGYYTYEVGSLDEDDAGNVGGIYAEELLVATGRRVPFENVAFLAEDPTPTGRHVELLDARFQVIAGRGFTIVDDVSDHRP